jgi:hypothetical protein
MAVHLYVINKDGCVPVLILNAKSRGSSLENANLWIPCNCSALGRNDKLYEIYIGDYLDDVLNIYY